MQFRHAGISVRNLERSIKFYELLGFNEITRNTEKGTFIRTVTGGRDPLTYVKMQLTRTDFILELYEIKIMSNSPEYHHLAFTVTHLNDIYERLEERGITFLSPPLVDTSKKHLLCFCTDPDYNRIEFVEELK